MDQNDIFYPNNEADIAFIFKKIYTFKIQIGCLIENTVYAYDTDIVIFCDLVCLFAYHVHLLENLHNKNTRNLFTCPLCVC